jgi:GNAT superfamily N-acetyltransferase
MAGSLDEQHLRLRRPAVNHHGDRGAPPAAEDLRSVGGERATEIVDREHREAASRGSGPGRHPESQTRIAVALRLGLRDVTGVGADVDGEPRGFLGSLVGAGAIGQVEDLYVEPEVRHRNLATALLHRAVADCRARGARPVLIVPDASDTPKAM